MERHKQKILGLSRIYSIIKKTEYIKERLIVRAVYVNCQRKGEGNTLWRKKKFAVMMNMKCATDTILKLFYHNKQS